MTNPEDKNSDQNSPFLVPSYLDELYKELFGENWKELQITSPELINKATTMIRSLKEDSNKFQALQAMGVDNWDGYEEAMEMANKS